MLAHKTTLGAQKMTVCQIKALLLVPECYIQALQLLYN